MKTGRTLVEMAQEIARQATTKKDLIAPVEKLAAEVTPVPDSDKPEVRLVVQNGTTEAYPIQPYAHGQIAEYAGIPLAYYRRMQENDPSLLAENINRWLADLKAERRMVRILDGKVRAFLSDRYAPLDNEGLAEAILPVLLERKLSILSAEITERRLYIKAVDETILKDVPTGRKLGDGSHVFFDTVSPGIVISNSEIGAGRTSIETSIYTKACTNLALMGAPFKKAHLGGRADVSEDVYALLSDQTKQLTDQAVFGQIKDVVSGALDAVQFEAKVKKLGAAADNRIESTDVVQVVEKVGRKFQLGEGERQGILQRLIEGGDLTRYGLHAAITRHSADVKDYDRATELERLGGDVIDLAPSEWKVISTETK